MYQRAKIYKIEPVYDGDEGDVYIGSTCEKYLSNRMSGHRRKYKAWKNGKYNSVSVFKLFDKYGDDELDIVLLEKFPCDSKEELRAREGYHIKSMECINKLIAGRTIKQYEKDNREKIKEHKKQYYETNRDRIYERNKKYRKDNKDKIKQHYQHTKEKVKARKSQKHVCICGVTYTHDNKLRHERTQKHLKYIANHEDTSDSDSDSDSDDE